MLTTTTPSVEGKQIQDYLGIVTGEAVLGANLFKDFFAEIRDVVGGRSGAYEKELCKAREMALEDLQNTATELGANAAVAKILTMKYWGERNGMLMVSVSGTAIKLV